MSQLKKKLLHNNFLEYQYTLKTN